MLEKILAKLFPPNFRGQLRKDHPKQTDAAKESLQWYTRCHRSPYSHEELSAQYDLACARKLVKTAKEC